MNSFFISLGGGNEIGASSYYLHIDGMNFLLDAGLRYVNRKRYPAFSELSKFQFIDGVNDLDAIFISHAHYDHNGALPLLVSKLIEKKDIFCSEYTKKFTEIQLNILKKKMGILQYELYEDIMVDRTLGMIKECPINQRVTNKEYNFTLYDSGHIPGATMIYLERGEKKVLYTGDFSDREYAITKRYNLPTIENLDLLIINSTYAHRKEDIDSWKLGENQLKKVLEHIKLYKKVNLKINHVNQGMELAIFLNEELENKGNENIKIYVAEFLKLELSDKVFNAKFAGSQVSDDEEFEISEMDIYKGMEFEDYLTKSDIEKVYEPILGRHLTLDDINRIEKLVSDENMKNIVFPILDVLAKYKRGGNDVKIDAVILNGGMTKFYLIKDRIKELFNIEPITVNDPDLAVAKGAAFFQYCSEKVNFLEKIQNTPSILTEGKEEKNIVELNNLKNFEKEIDIIKNSSNLNNGGATRLTLGNVIVNETINLGLTKGHAKLLVKEGTKLPVKDIKLENLVIPVGTKEIELPIYLGNEPRTDSPHMRKINTRKIILNKTYAPGTPITLNLTIDENKNLYFNGYVGDNQYERISVIMETTKSNSDEKATKIISTDSKELNVGTEMETLRSSAEILEDIRKKYNGTKKNPYITSKLNNAKFKIDQTKTDIINSTNKEKFENAIIDELGKLENNRLLKGILFELGSHIYSNMTEKGKKNFLKACENMLCLEYMLNNYNKDNIIKAIIAIETIGETTKEREIEKLLDKSAARNYHENLARTLGKVSKYNKKIITNFLTISIDSLEINPYIYGVGETFNTDEMLYLEEITINAILERLLKILKQKRSNRDMALTAMVKIFKTLEEQKYDIDKKLFKRIVEDIKVLIEEEFDDKFKLKLLNGFSKMIDVK